MRLTRHWPRTIIALLLLLTTIAVDGARALQDQATLTQSVAIHPGTCEDFAPDPAYDLGAVSPRFEEAVEDTAGAPREETVELIGFPGAPPVDTADATLSATFDDIFSEDQPHSLVVHGAADLSRVPVACGELGGVEANGRILIALLPQNDSGQAGVGIFDEDESGFLGIGEDEVNITVYVFQVAPAIVPDASSPPPASAQDAESNYAHPDWLADVDWLEAQFDPTTGELGDVENLTVIGVFSRDEAQEALAPLTVHFDPALLALTDTSEESVEDWRTQVLVQILPLGQSPDSAELQADEMVVLYDDGSLAATALWWAMDYLGHGNKRLLNGGLEAWIEQNELPGGGFPPAGTGPRVPPGDVPESLSGGIDPDVLATIDEIEGVLEDPNVVLVDARSPEEYAVGHLPGAVNIPASENVEPGAIPYWADAAQLRDRYAAAGVTPDKRVIAYGGDGFAPHVTYFTLRLLGYEQVAVYPGGWVEWRGFPALPIETGD
jgi:thiosulfate/3-mercaptopyruvate sulfurtransferase